MRVPQSLSLALVLLVVFCSFDVGARFDSVHECNTDVSDATSFIWNGLDHFWQRRYFGFRVPHRFASTKNYFDCEKHLLCDNNEVLSKANAEFGMTPGVDGDYAYPKMKYSRIHSKGLHVERFSPRVSFTDNATGDPPVAETREVVNVNITLPDKNCTFVPVLNGFEFTTYCDPNKQSEGNKCNSDGFWPIKMELGITHCSVDGLVLNCSAVFDLKRGWTPSHGGHRPFNYVLDYNVTLFMSVLVAQENDFVPNPFEFADVVTDVVHDETTTKFMNVQGVTSTSITNAIVAFQSLQFELQSKHAEKGRYCARFQSEIGVESYDSASGAANVSFSCAFFGGNECYSSNAVFKARGNLIQSSPTALIDVEETSGSVCIKGHDEPTVLDLNCEKLGIPYQNSDEVIVTLERD